MIKLGGCGFWYHEAYGFSSSATGPRWLDDRERRQLVRYLCGCLWRTPRWQGEVNEHGETWSVGQHSVLVAALCGRLALARGLDLDTARLAVRVGAAHDLGEALGLGDIAAPWLRLDERLRRWAADHQRAAYALVGVDDGGRGPLEVSPYTEHDEGDERPALVRDADRVAAALERRLHFGDASHDMEHRTADAVLEELHLRPTAWHEIVEPASVADWLLLLRPGHDLDVKVLGQRMIDCGDPVAPRR